MQKHHYTFLSLLFALGAMIGLVVSIYGFVTWLGLGFALESKYLPKTPGLEAGFVFIIGLVASGYCANQAGIMSHHSKDKIPKSAEADEEKRSRTVLKGGRERATA
jgi:hypothetical protein